MTTSANYGLETEDESQEAACEQSGQSGCGVGYNFKKLWKDMKAKKQTK